MLSVALFVSARLTVVLQFEALRSLLDADMQSADLFPPGEVYWLTEPGDVVLPNEIKSDSPRLFKVSRYCFVLRRALSMNSMNLILTSRNTTDHWASRHRLSANAVYEEHAQLSSPALVHERCSQLPLIVNVATSQYDSALILHPLRFVLVDIKCLQLAIGPLGYPLLQRC